jgi:hypothetical protein
MRYDYQAKRAERIFPVKKLYLFLLIGLVGVLLPLTANAQSPASEVTPLNNKDVVLMVAHKVDPEAIVKTIKNSPCVFDTFPPVMLEMRSRGVPPEVLVAMVEAPYGPSLVSNSRDDLGEQPIYHYAEALRQLGFLSPVTSARRAPAARQRARASRTRQRR